MTPPVPIVITAESERAWSAAVRAVADMTVAPEGLARLGQDLAARADSAHRYRNVVLAHDPLQLRRLDDTSVRATPLAGPLAFLFSGQSSQRPQMGAHLAAEFPRFATIVDNACAVVDPVLARPLREVLDDPGDTADQRVIDRTEYTQPALMAFGSATRELLSSVGVEPDIVCGHSFGELVAAAGAGVWTTTDALRIAAERGRLIGAMPTGGAMIAIEAAEADVAVAMSGTDVEFSALHSPGSVVIAGPLAQVRTVAAAFGERGVRTAELPGANAFHSAAVEPVLDPLRDAIAAIAARPAAVRLVGNASGRFVPPGEVVDPTHWVRHCRRTVRWSEQMATLGEAGTHTYLEVGPSGVLSRLAASNLPADGHDSVIAAVLPEPDEVTSFLTALARLDARGHRVDWPAVFAESTRLTNRGLT